MNDLFIVCAIVSMVYVNVHSAFSLRKTFYIYFIVQPLLAYQIDDNNWCFTFVMYYGIDVCRIKYYRFFICCWCYYFFFYVTHINIIILLIKMYDNWQMAINRIPAGTMSF